MIIKPEIGAEAPQFTVLNQKNELISLGNFLGQYVVIYFYPKAMTPGCTVQACTLRDTHTNFQALNAVVLGVSPDKPSALKKFAEKEALPFTLLSDPNRKIIGPYAVWVEKSLYGKKYMGVERSTFIINPEGKIAQVFTNVDPKTHANEVLSWLKQQ